MTSKNAARRPRVTPLAVALMATLAGAPSLRAQAPAAPAKADKTPVATPTGVEAKADEVMRRMAAFLSGTTRFTVEAEETFDVEMARAYRVALTNVRTLTLERPNRFAADATGDTVHRSSWFDGKTLHVLNRKKNVYAAVEAPGTIDDVLDKVARDYEVVLPLSDLLYSDPYATLMAGVLYGKYLGIHRAAGVPCHHLTFGQGDGLYWQIWVDTGDQPFPRKLALAYWDEPGVPHYEAVFRKWTVNPPGGQAIFQWKAPAGSKKVTPEELVGAAVSELSRAVGGQ
jgi:hypothetical protein